MDFWTTNMNGHEKEPKFGRGNARLEKKKFDGITMEDFIVSNGKVVNLIGSNGRVIDLLDLEL